MSIKNNLLKLANSHYGKFIELSVENQNLVYDSKSIGSFVEPRITKKLNLSKPWTALAQNMYGETVTEAAIENQTEIYLRWKSTKLTLFWKMVYLNQPYFLCLSAFTFGASDKGFCKPWL